MSRFFFFFLNVFILEDSSIFLAGLGVSVPRITGAGGLKKLIISVQIDF